ADDHGASSTDNVTNELAPHFDLSGLTDSTGLYASYGTNEVWLVANCAVFGPTCFNTPVAGAAVSGASMSLQVPIYHDSDYSVVAYQRFTVGSYTWSGPSSPALQVTTDGTAPTLLLSTSNAPAQPSGVPTDQLL